MFAKTNETEAPTDDLPLETGAQPSEAILGSEWPVSADDDEGNRSPHGDVRDRERQVIEQVQRQLVGPVQIVDDDERGRSLGELDHRMSHGQEQPEFLVVRVT